MLLFGILAVPAMAEEAQPGKVGMLAFLNLDEAKMLDIRIARRILAQMDYRQIGDAKTDFESISRNRKKKLTRD